VERSNAWWPGIGGGAGKLGRLKVGDGTDIWGPVDRETWERRPARKAQSKREDVFSVKTRPTRGLDGPAGTVSACGGGAASGLAGLRGRPGGPQGRPGRNKKKEFLN
jgi:hypothetical protein